MKFLNFSHISVFCLLSSVFSSLYADNTIANAIAATTAASVVNTGTMVYWQSQGVSSTIVTAPNGTTYVAPNLNPGENAPSTPPQNQYQSQNNQESKQDFFNH